MYIHINCLYNRDNVPLHVPCLGSCFHVRMFRRRFDAKPCHNTLGDYRRNEGTRVRSGIPVGELYARHMRSLHSALAFGPWFWQYYYVEVERLLRLDVWLDLVRSCYIHYRLPHLLLGFAMYTMEDTSTDFVQLQFQAARADAGCKMVIYIRVYAEIVRHCRVQDNRSRKLRGLVL